MGLEVFAMSRKLQVEVVSLSEVFEESTEVLRGRDQHVVLVVDDERIIADTLSIILTKSGFSVMTAYDGMSALELADGRAPDLLISDVMMPGMSGIDLAITLTETMPACKVLLFSGQAATVDLLEKSRAAGHEFTALTKPVHPSVLLKHISTCLTMPDGVAAIAGGESAGAGYLYQ
jgi:CheY-like chemotaxis protein